MHDLGAWCKGWKFCGRNRATRLLKVLENYEGSEDLLFNLKLKYPGIAYFILYKISKSWGKETSVLDFLR